MESVSVSMLIKDNMGNLNTLVLLCIQKGENDLARSIINKALPYNLFDYNRSLLHHAVECDNAVIAQYLIDKGWDLKATNEAGETPLAIALKRGKADMISTLHRLLDGKKGNSVIDSEIDKRIRETKLKWPKDLQSVKEVLDELTRGCSNDNEIAEKLLQSNCPLAAVVCAFKNAELTRLMLDRGCPVDGRLASTGETALHLAVEDFDVGNVKLLVERGAEIDARDDKNDTPLSRFEISSYISEEKLEILELLLNRGASLAATCSRRRNSDWSSDRPKPTIMHQLLLEGDDRTLRVLIPYIDLDHRDANGRTPLHHLVNNKNPAALEVLRGKHIDANAPDNNRWTPRDIAVCRAYSQKLQFLLENGASLNNSIHDGDIALRCLIYDFSKSEEARNVFQLLLLYDVDLEVITRHRQTSNALCSAMENLDFAKVLLAHLAKLESFGVPVSDFFDEKIKSNDGLKDLFDSYKRQMEVMKVTTIYESVTLYKLLSESQKTLIMYARNEEFQLQYESVKNNKYLIHPYYVKSLSLRVDIAIVIAKMKNEAACIICRVTGWPTSMVCTVAYKIVDYLNQNDLENIIKI